jgi:hypothetical protein
MGSCKRIKKGKNVDQVKHDTYREFLFDFPELRPGQAPQTPNSACGLTIPTVPDLLKVRHREKLQDSLESARLIAESSNPSNFGHEYKLR